MLNFLPIIANLLGIGGDYVAKQMDLKKAKLDAEIEQTKAESAARVAMAQKAAQGEIDWDLAVANQMEHSWKDEWLTILFSIPLVLAFIPFPWADQAVQHGFASLAKMPQWYSYAVGLMVAATFGYRKFVDYMGKFK